MTETERWVNQACERIVSLGHVRLYRDLYKDLRRRMPCGEACRLLEGGLRLTRTGYYPIDGMSDTYRLAARARAIAALRRLARWAEPCGGLH